MSYSFDRDLILYALYQYCFSYVEITFFHLLLFFSTWCFGVELALVFGVALGVRARRPGRENYLRRPTPLGTRVLLGTSKVSFTLFSFLITTRTRICFLPPLSTALSKKLRTTHNHKLSQHCICTTLNLILSYYKLHYGKNEAYSKETD